MRFVPGRITATEDEEEEGEEGGTAEESWSASIMMGLVEDENERDGEWVEVEEEEGRGTLCR
jgi:hypothetical protein